MKTLKNKLFIMSIFSITTAGYMQTAPAQQSALLNMAQDLQSLQGDALASIDCVLELLQNLATLMQSFKKDVLTLSGAATNIINNPLGALGDTAQYGVNAGVNAAQQGLQNVAVGMGKATLEVNKATNNAANKVSDIANDVSGKITGAANDVAGKVSDAANDALKKLKNLKFPF